MVELPRALIRLGARVFLRGLYALSGEGAGWIPRRGPAMIVSNHPSYYDPFLLSAFSPRPITFLAWERLFEIPLLGSFIRTLGTIPVPVDAASKEALRRSLATLREGRITCVFPEGGRTRTPPLDPFKEGAFRIAARAEVPVIPAAIRGASEIWPRGRRLPRAGGRIRVSYLPPLPAGLPPAEAARRAREAILERLSRGRGAPGP